MLMTTDYGMFKFREDNRKEVDQRHVKKLMFSIASKNLLDMRPISVNGDFEIIDGQHRLMAARALNVPIYYIIEKRLESQDIILMNVVKTWTMSDYLNYYVKNGNIHYQKLNDFCIKNNISLKVAMTLTMGNSMVKKNNFKEGTYEYVIDDTMEACIDVCWRTIEFIKKMNGVSVYLTTGRFWLAMLKLISHTNFSEKKWFSNLARMSERLGIRASTDDYLKLFMEIHNWRNNSHVDLFEEKDFDK